MSEECLTTTDSDDYELRDEYDLSKMTIVAKGRYAPLMREEYDFSQSIKNPYAEHLRKPVQRPTTLEERSVTMPGPYFPGQLPASCGHYYPDVLRLRDEKRSDGTFVRIIDCAYCGRSELQFDPRMLPRELLRKLNRKGLDVGIREEEISKVRKRELRRLLSR